MNSLSLSNAVRPDVFSGGTAARETVSNVGVVWVRLAAADRESGTKWRVMVELIGSDGTIHAHDVNAG